MKKFILATLASTFLLPTPIFAAEEMDSVVVSEEFEELDSSVVEMNESTSTTVKIQFKDKENKNVGSAVTINKSKIQEELIVNIPRGYYFVDAIPSSFDADSADIKIVKTSEGNLSSKPTDYDGKAPIYVKCQSGKDPIQVVTFNNSSELTDGKISAQAINTKLKDKKLPYKVSSGLDYQYLDTIYAKEGSEYKIVGYRNIDPLALTKISDDEFEGTEIEINFGTGSAKAYVQDLKPNNGKVTLSQGTLEAALNAYAQAQAEKDNTTPKFTYKVSKLASNITFNAYGAEKYTLTPDEKSKTTIYAILSEKTPVDIKVVNTNGGGILIESLNNLTLKDLGLKAASAVKEDYGKINDTNADVKGFFTKNYDKLTYDGCTFNSTFAVDLTKSSESTLSNSIKGTVKASLKYDPSTLYDREYTLVFENAAQPGQIVDRDKRKWRAFFKSEVAPVLTATDFTADVLPTGWSVSTGQYEGSAQKNKKEVAEVTETASTTKSGLNISIFSSDEIKVYIQGGRMPSGGGTTNTPEPEEPTTPDTPTTPEEPMAPSIPSQGCSVMYRVYNPQTHEHLYTQDAEERDNLLASGWNDEGHGWTAPAISSYKVYRVFNPNSGEHHYTMDQNEYDTLIRYGWTGEGTAFFSANDVDNKVTLYRLYHPNAPESAKHHYTMDENERNQMIADGWISEGTAWYGLPN